MALEAGSPGQTAPARQATSAALSNQSPMRFELAPQIIGGLTRQAVQFSGGSHQRPSTVAHQPPASVDPAGESCVSRSQEELMTRALAALVLFAALPSQALTDRSGPYELQVLIGGAPTRTFRHDGETFVLGHLGQRYTLRIFNRSGRRIEAVISVDGRDVIDGKPADWREKRGYLVPAWGSVDIDGWRLSQQEAAAFSFSTVSESYAARTGNAREVGVIGVAIFPERWYPPPRPLYPMSPAPWNGGLRDGLEG